MTLRTLLGLVVSLGLMAACGGGDNAGVDATASDSVPALSTTVAPSTTSALDPSDEQGGPSEGGTSTTAEASEVCTQLQIVQDLSDEISLATSELIRLTIPTDGGRQPDEADLLAQFDTVAEELDASLSDVLDAYAAAASAAEPAIAADITAVADGTALLTPILIDVFRDATSIDDLADFDTRFADPVVADAATSAGLASLNLDEFTVPECGFRFSN